MSWSIVVPVKMLGEAKTRLLPRDDPARPELALAFVEDCVRALLRTPSVAVVRLVSNDERVQRLADRMGAAWCAEPAMPGLNEAAQQGFVGATGPVGVVAGDLPCLTPASMELVCRLADEVSSGFVCDAQGTGTTMLFNQSAADCRPAFGERSRARHRAMGAVDLGLTAGHDDRRLLARARRDVDTTVDLADALRIGVGGATRRVIDWRSAP